MKSVTFAANWFGTFLLVCTAAWAVKPADAAPILWSSANGGNDHYYDIVMPAATTQSWTWTAARTAAAQTVFQGSSGHLVTVGSAAENEFLATQFQSFLHEDLSQQTGQAYAWIGLAAATPTSNLEWITGEPVTYTNWAPSEPNFYGLPYWQYTHYWTRNFGNGPTWTWNNERDAITDPPYNFYGYIVEFEGPFSSTVPEPATLVLLAIGTLCLFRRRVVN